MYREQAQAALDSMEADMKASPYEWEMFFFTPDMNFDLLTQKLHKKNWDIVMVGSKSPHPVRARKDSWMAKRVQRVSAP